MTGPRPFRHASGRPSVLRAYFPAVVAGMALAACGGAETGRADAAVAVQEESAKSPGALPQGSNFALDTSTPRAVALDKLPAGVFEPSGRSREVLAVQVLLDRARFSPGVIDGRMGENVRQAIAAFEKAQGLTVDGEVDAELLARLRKGDSRELLREYTITEADVRGPFLAAALGGMEAQARLDRLSYRDPAELLAEKFHMDRDFLEALNPETDFGAAGATIRVVDRGRDELPTAVARIEVDKGEKAVRAYDEGGRLIAFYPATIGSSALQSPSGKTEVTAVAPQPKYYFDPSSRSWGPDRKLTIAAGPNNPVGSVWIDLARDGYGLHGTPEPANIGKTASHGCVRLTNWDAEELASGVSPGVPVIFKET